MKMGVDNSFLVRGNAVDVFRNRAGALWKSGVRVNLATGGARITPTKGLADAERSCSAAPTWAAALYQMDLERECVIAEWLPEGRRGRPHERHRRRDQVVADGGWTFHVPRAGR